ncbi:hypothetical protein [Geodermatophilus telluris]|uniref:hypothetical protein n=1 Tax=Geodermatophilus telluris TaxID=1190417 RepID=UPI0011135FA9|nr:hypothetical protein [Geodermatophilus telluris]
MLRWVCVAVAGVVLSGSALLLVAGHHTYDGPVLLQVSATHGLHVGDLFVVAGWAVAMTVLGLLARPRRPVSRAGRRGPWR